MLTSIDAKLKLKGNTFWFAVSILSGNVTT